MMHHTEALILKKDEWGEADWLITALSADFGKIRLLAQGARKHGAKLQGHLEPGSVSGLSFVVGRNGYRLTGARLAAFPTAVRGSLSKTRALNIILQALVLDVIRMVSLKQWWESPHFCRTLTILLGRINFYGFP